MNWDCGPVSEVPASRRRALRRAIRLGCDVHSRSWNGGVRFEATDVSPHGLWIETSLPLEPGEPVLVRFTPPNWPVWTPPLEARARVARAGLARRRGEPRPSGMGLRFIDLSPVSTGLLALALRGLPPPLPRRQPAPSVHVRPAAPPIPDALPARVADAAPAVEASELRFTALAPLLTSGRLTAPPPAGLGVVIPFPSRSMHVQGARRRHASARSPWLAHSR